MMGGVEVKLDTAIVLDAQSGSREGFTRLYEAVAPALYRTALYTLGNSHDAEDVVSEPLSRPTVALPACATRRRL